MPASFLEIVELDDGEVVLQRVDDDAEPLLRIKFSEESRLYIMDNGLEIAKVMIQSGIQAAAAMAEQGEIDIESEREGTTHIVH
ncbi:MAG: hypothetical protein ACI9B9_001356 [Halioglobus sp.]